MAGQPDPPAAEASASASASAQGPAAAQAQATASLPGGDIPKPADRDARSFGLTDADRPTRQANTVPLALPRWAQGGSPADPSPAPASSGRLRLLKSPAPAYPLSARRRGAQGTALIRARVSASGKVTQVELARSSGSGDLDQSSLQAVRRWRFLPLSEPNAVPELWVTVPIRFRLENRRF